MLKNEFSKAIQYSSFMILELQGSRTIKRGSKGFVIDLLKSTSSLHNSTHILYTKENPKPNRLPKYMIKPLHILHPPFWFILGGSLCEDLGFFHSFKTSPRSSKSESGCKSCACFSFQAAAVWFGRIIRVLSHIIRALPGSSGFLPGSSGLFVKFITEAYSASRIIRLPTRIIRELPGSSGYVPGHPGIYFTTLYIDLPGSSGHCPDHPGMRPDHPGRSTTAGNGSIFFGGINIPLPLRGRVEHFIPNRPKNTSGSLSLLLHQILDPGEISECS